MKFKIPASAIAAALAFWEQAFLKSRDVHGVEDAAHFADLSLCEWLGRWGDSKTLNRDETVKLFRVVKRRRA